MGDMSVQLLQMALAHYCTPEPEQFYSRERWLREAPVREALAEMDLIVRVGDSLGQPAYARTDRLVAYVEHLLRQPLPVQVWMVPAEEDW